MTKEERNEARKIYKTNTQKNQVLAVIRDRESKGYRIHPLTAIWKGVRTMFGGRDWKTKDPIKSITRIVRESKHFEWVAEGTVGSGRARTLAVR